LDFRLFAFVFGFASHHAIVFLLFTFDHDPLRPTGEALVGGFSMNIPIIEALLPI
jgi:hypothetical protein